jgi:CheY-like chemotaxis protein
MTEPRSEAGAGLKVLVIEDETLQSMDLEIMLEELGHKIAGVAPHREGAMKLIDRLGGDIDCVLLDCKLGVRSSRPVADRLARRRIPYVVISGLPEGEVRRLGYAGAHVSKPFTAREVNRVLRRAAETAAPGDV